MNPILAALARTLVGVTAAHAKRDREAVEAAFERAAQLAGRTEIEFLDVDGAPGRLQEPAATAG